MIKNTTLEFEDGTFEIEVEVDGGYYVNGTLLTEEEMLELRDALSFFLADQDQAAYDDGYADGWNDAMEQPENEGELN